MDKERTVNEGSPPTFTVHTRRKLELVMISAAVLFAVFPVDDLSPYKARINLATIISHHMF